MLQTLKLNLSTICKLQHEVPEPDAKSHKVLDFFSQTLVRLNLTLITQYIKKIILIEQVEKKHITNIWEGVGVRGVGAD